MHVGGWLRVFKKTRAQGLTAVSPCYNKAQVWPLPPRKVCWSLKPNSKVSAFCLDAELHLVYISQHRLTQKTGGSTGHDYLTFESNSTILYPCFAIDPAGLKIATLIFLPEESAVSCCLFLKSMKLNIHRVRKCLLSIKNKHYCHINVYLFKVPLINESLVWHHKVFEYTSIC